MIFAILGKLSTLSQCWAGPIYAAFICGVVMIYFFTTHSYERAFPVFFFILANGVLLRGGSASQE